MVSDSVGYDAGKKADAIALRFPQRALHQATKGRKRFTMVDTLGLLLMVKVVAADVQERDGAKQLLTKMNEERHRVPRLTRIWFVDLWSAFGNGGFSGPDFLHWVMDVCHWIVDVVLRPNGSKGFVLLPKRWTVVGEACRRHTDLRLAPLVSSS